MRLSEKNYGSSVAKLLFKQFSLLILFFVLVSSLTVQKAFASDFKDDYLKTYNSAADKLTQLAEAIPSGKYDWSPAEGVRSVKDVLMHVAGASFFLSTRLGASMPEGIDPRSLAETVKTKEKAIEVLKKSIEQARSAIENVTEQQLDDEVNLRGNKGTKRWVVFIIGDHTAEHLGQLIAYARMNGVVPPWSK